MHLNITGFLPYDNEDDSLKFNVYLDPSFNEPIARLLGHSSADAMSEWLWELNGEQINLVSEAIGEKLPRDLQLFIGFVV